MWDMSQRLCAVALFHTVTDRSDRRDTGAQKHPYKDKGIYCDRPDIQSDIKQTGV